jgi:hypothetical protein
MVGSNPGISVYDQENTSRYSWNRDLYATISSGEHASPRVISSMTLGLTEMSILMVGEILAMLPSSNVSGVGIGFLNQSTWPEGMKYFSSMVQTGASVGG